MSPLHLQALLGHSSLEMVKHYAQMVEDDLLQAHKQTSPVDHLGRLRGVHFSFGERYEKINPPGLEAADEEKSGTVENSIYGRGGGAVR